MPGEYVGNTMEAAEARQKTGSLPHMLSLSEIVMRNSAKIEELERQVAVKQAIRFKANPSPVTMRGERLVAIPEPTLAETVAALCRRLSALERESKEIRGLLTATETPNPGKSP
jgi:hypothetical protein